MLIPAKSNGIVGFGIRAGPASDGAAAVWRRYLTVWTAWNHVRTVAGLAASGAFVLALIQD